MINAVIQPINEIQQQRTKPLGFDEDCDKNEIDLPLDHFQECILSFLLDETLSWLVHEKSG